MPVPEVVPPSPPSPNRPPKTRLAQGMQRLQQHPMLANFLRNISWNLFGQAAPLLVALLSFPILIKHLGTERFGLMTIAWMLVGYFSFFDFGLGRALTQVLAKRMAGFSGVNTARSARLPLELTHLVWTGLLLMTLLGSLMALLLAACIGPIVENVLNVPSALQAELKIGMWWLLAALPFVVLSTGLRGMLEAHHAFKMLNLVRMPLGIFTYLGPVLVLPWSHNMALLFGVLFFVRLLSTGLFLWACQNVHRGFWRIGFVRANLPELLQFGGWLTISNIVSPLMVNLDRLLIGSMLTLSAVAFYTTPFEMISALLVLPGAVAGVCFPLFTQHWQRGEHAKVAQVFWQSARYLGLAMAGLALLIFCASPWLLQLWLNKEFAEQSSTVLRILAIGVFINGLAYIPYALIQGMGAAKVTAQFHLLEVLLYVPLLFGLLKLWGINGVAVAWLLRVSLDCALLYWYAIRKLREKAGGGDEL